MDNDSLYAIAIAFFICGLPCIALAAVIRVMIARKNRQAEEETRAKVHSGINSKKQFAPQKQVSPQRAIVTFIGMAIVIVFAGSLIGFVVALFSSLVYIVFLFPFGMGLVGGRIVADAVRIAKLRKLYPLIFLSLLMAIPMSASFHYGRYIGLQVQMSFEMFPGAALEDESLATSKAVVDYAMKQETGYPGFIGYMLLRANEGVSIGRFYSSSRVNLGPVLTWLYWILEFGIILWITINMGRKMIGRSFCEFCGKWYGEEKHLGGTTGANESIVLDLIKQKDFLKLGKLMEKNAEVPSVEIYFQGCEACDQGTSRLIMRRASQDGRGMLHFTDASQTVLSPGDGIRLLNQLSSIGN